MATGKTKTDYWVQSPPKTTWKFGSIPSELSLCSHGTPGHPKLDVLRVAAGNAGECWSAFICRGSPPPKSAVAFCVVGGSCLPLISISVALRVVGGSCLGSVTPSTSATELVDLD